jgi:hypothetical protein
MGDQEVQPRRTGVTGSFSGEDEEEAEAEKTR